MKLKLREVISIHNAIAALNGREVVVKAKEGGEDRVVLQPYLIKGQASWNFAKNLRILGRIGETFDRARKDILGRIDQSLPAKELAQAQIEADKELVEILEGEEEVNGLLMIPLEHLRIEENEKAGTPIQLDVLRSLIPIIQE